MFLAISESLLNDLDIFPPLSANSLAAVDALLFASSRSLIGFVCIFLISAFISLILFLTSNCDLNAES